MRVVVTGGSGFLGRQIVHAAERRGWRVLAPRRTECNLETGAGLSQFAELARSDGAVDALVHSAAYYGGLGITLAEPSVIFERNVAMALRVFELARVLDVGRLAVVGSACAYPGAVGGDMREDDFWAGALHESVEAYGFTKKVLLVGQRALYRQHGIAPNHLVVTNLYGPHDVFTEYRSHVVSALIKKFADAARAEAPEVTLWGDGTPVREFLFVEDAAEAIVRALEAGPDLAPMNVGTGVGTTIAELAGEIQALTGFRGVVRWDTSKPNGAARKVLDVTRMKKALGWYPEVPLREGLRRTVQWYLEHKDEADARE